MGLPNPTRESKFSGANGDKEIFIFSVQLTTSRIGNLSRLIYTLATVCVCLDHTILSTGITTIILLYLVCCTGQPKVALSLKTRMVKAEAIEALLDGCSTWTLRQEHYAKLRTVHHRVLLRIIGAQRKRPDHRMTSYNRALEITGCESIETTLRTRRLLWAGTLLRMSGGRLPKRIMFGNLEGAVRRGRGGKEK